MTTTEAQLREHAVTLVLALMASASTKRIPPKAWWDRAQSALLTGATRDSLDECVTTMSRKLQIDSLRSESANSISSLASSLDEWEPLRRYCERCAQMIVALARVRRDRQREDAGEIREHQRPIEAQLANALDREREQAAEIDRLRARVGALTEDVRVLTDARNQK